MKGFFYILLFIVVAIISWGVYGPLLGLGQHAMHDGLRPFMCVGLAYFAIAVVVPMVLLQLFGEKGHWSATGIIWSMVAGLSGAIGALGVILAASNHGNMLYVMPLVFGGAPVVNSILTIYLARAYKQVGPIFIAGLILVIAGSVTVLLARPHGPTTGPALDFGQLTLVCLFTALTAVAFGCYGPTLHKGQVAMAGSRLRPFLGVGAAYFLVAVLVPGLLLGIKPASAAPATPSAAKAASTPATTSATASATSAAAAPKIEPPQWNFWGTIWSLAGGAVGAIGALGVIMAFNLGGKPVYVMPLVFGGAPVVNTFVELIRNNVMSQIGPIFIAGLIMTAAGAVTVLVFAPRSHAPAHGMEPLSAAPSKIEPKPESV